MSYNRATIFSNGIADFRRRFAVKKQAPTEIAIPVRKDHVADVLASLNVYGQVALKEPPSFRPANEDAGAIAIDTDSVIESLITQLSGAQVNIERGGGPLAGTLVGLQGEQQGTGGERIEAQYAVVLTPEGLQKVSLHDVQQLQFSDEDVQTEIDKALRRSFQEIKPHSTFVELALSTEEDETEATIQYTIPAAAWKISYRLRGDGDGKFDFQGFAVVDNNTDEDWNDFLISVVTGEPITFSTDLAESKTPRRNHVNVVRDTALGAVEVEEGDYADDMAIMASAAPAAGESMKLSHRRAGRAMMSKQMLADAEMLAEPAAATEEATARDVSDFCLFEAQSPVTIAANRSAVIPVFQVTFDKARTVLHYKMENHAERPFRAIDFENETSFSLERGVCTVYEAGTYVGSCLIPSTKPAGQCLLPHALETGVRVRHQPKRLRRKTVGLRLTQGFCYTSYHESQVTDYRIKSGKQETFSLVLDHDFLLPEPEVQCHVTYRDGSTAVQEVAESLQHGIRLRLDLEPGAELTLTVDEQRTDQSRIQLVAAAEKEGNINAHWLRQNLVQTNGPLADNDSVRRCLEIQATLDDKQGEINKAVAETQRLTERQERLRKNITTGGHDEQTSRWKTQLGQSEEKLVELEDELIPRLRDESRTIEHQLRAAMLELAAEWKTSK